MWRWSRSEATAAECLLPPTRSLVQTKRKLSALPGGGGTPLASGLKSAMELALQARGRGMTPVIVPDRWQGEYQPDRTGRSAHRHGRCPSDRNRAPATRARQHCLIDMSPDLAPAFGIWRASRRRIRAVAARRRSTAFRCGAHGDGRRVTCRRTNRPRLGRIEPILRILRHPVHAWHLQEMGAGLKSFYCRMARAARCTALGAYCPFWPSSTTSSPPICRGTASPGWGHGGGRGCVLWR